MAAVQDHPDLELLTVVGASALLHRFGNVREIMERDGFKADSTVYTIIEGENPTTMAKSTGLAIIELATIFENLKPDIALTVADRFETMATAVAASYMNIPVAHTQGGEVTGSIDESVRHAVTKLSHLHFPATELARDNVLRMGEDPATVFLTGCPAIDAIADIDYTISRDFFERYQGVGPALDPARPYMVVLQHPVTTEYGQGLAQIEETLAAVAETGMQTAWLWPNVDAGSDQVSKGLRRFRENNPAAPLHFYLNFEVTDYARLINGAACLVGNSSSALREGSYLGVPAVNIGSRQGGRERGDNVIDAGYDRAEIAKAIADQLAHGRYERSLRFGDGTAGKQIAEVLATAQPKVQKRLAY